MKSQTKVVFEKICSENQAEILAWLTRKKFQSRLKLITALNRLNFTLFKHTQFMVSSIHQKLKIRRNTGLETFTNFVIIFIIIIVT